MMAGIEILKQAKAMLIDNMKVETEIRSTLAAEDMKRSSNIECLKKQITQVEDAISKLQDSD